SPQPAHQRARPEHDLRHRPGSWRPGRGGTHLSGRLLHRDLSEHRAQPERAKAALSPILLALRHPDLIVACIVGDGEAETGALAASWHSNKFLNPARDGAVLPILHLNGFKIA